MRCSDADRRSNGRVCRVRLDNRRRCGGRQEAVAAAAAVQVKPEDLTRVIDALGPGSRSWRGDRRGWCSRRRYRGAVDPIANIIIIPDYLARGVDAKGIGAGAIWPVALMPSASVKVAEGLV